MTSKNDQVYALAELVADLRLRIAELEKEISWLRSNWTAPEDEEE